MGRLAVAGKARGMTGQARDAASTHRCAVRQDNLAYGLVRCDRFAGHEGQHEAVRYDLAWGPQEPTGKWVGDRWVRNAAS